MARDLSTASCQPVPERRGVPLKHPEPLPLIRDVLRLAGQMPPFTRAQVRVQNPAMPGEQPGCRIPGSGHSQVRGLLTFLAGCKLFHLTTATLPLDSLFAAFRTVQFFFLAEYCHVCVIVAEHCSAFAYHVLCYPLA